MDKITLPTHNLPTHNLCGLLEHNDSVDSGSTDKYHPRRPVEVWSGSSSPRPLEAPSLGASIKTSLIYIICQDSAGEDFACVR